MGIAARSFGTFGDERVDQFTLASETGVAVDILTWGVTVRDWRVPVAGGVRSVVLGFDSFAPYPGHSPHLGALAGRVANRIRGAAFALDGVACTLPANDGRNCLHGGPGGLGRLVWRAEPDAAANAVAFTHLSPDGAMGFPGNVEFRAVYSLRGNQLSLEFSATTDRTTPISLVQHHYFNLGEGPDVLDHRLQVEAGAFTELDAELLPTGVIRPVTGTPYDFTATRTLRDAAGGPIDCDINLVLDPVRDTRNPVATVTGPDGALTLRLWTDRPGLQVYDGVTTDVAVPGLGGRRYGRHSGLCLEDQAFPDAVHHRHFPSVWHTPERPYSHWCAIEIG